LLSDAVAFRRASGQPNVDLLEVARPAAERIHSQGIVVPYLAAKGDVATLAAVADNPKLTEEVRLGAIEGLAAAVSLEGEAALERVGRASSNSEDLRKAAWRGLRRSRRRRQPRQVKVGP
jgi:ParB family chromosome partitioning protein